MSNNITHVFTNANHIDLTIYQFGKEKCKPMLTCGPAIRNHYLLHYIVSGTGTFSSVDGKKYKLKPGQAFLIYPNTITTYTADAKNPWSYIWIEFDGLKASTYLLEAGLSLKSPIYTPSAPGKDKSLSEHLHFLLEHHGDSPLKLIGGLYFVLDALIQTSSNKKTSKAGNLHEFYAREAISFIENNYNKNISIHDVATWCNLDKSYFGKIFKDTVLVTPQEFLIKFRMNKACDLLRNSSLSIGDISLQVGYENQLHFSRAFKNTLGMSPREWKKQNR